MNYTQLFILRPSKGTSFRESKSTAAFNSLLAYSYLVFRLAKAKGDQTQGTCCVSEVAKGTGLTRRTIKAALDDLQASGHAALIGRRYAAVKPEEGSFMTRKSDGDQWYQQLSYLCVKLPQRKLTPRQNALYFYLKWQPHQRLAYYAECLDIDTDTVGAAIKRLRKLGLVSATRLEALEPTAANDVWSVPKPEAVTTPVAPQITAKTPEAKTLPEPQAVTVPVKQATGSDPLQAVYLRLLSDFKQAKDAQPRPEDDDMYLTYFCEREDFTKTAAWHAKLFANAALSPAEAAKYLTDTAKQLGTQGTEYFLWSQLDHLIDYSYRKTEANRSLGKFKGRNCLGMLTTVTNQILPTIRRNVNNWAWTCKQMLEDYVEAEAV